MDTSGNSTDLSTVFLLDYLNDSYARAGTDVQGSFHESKSDISSRSLGFGIPDTFMTKRIVHYCFGTLLILIGMAGTLGNILVLYVFTRYVISGSA
ncbi:unnamed protein product [Allacma fusca]|uniref:G-protein coupled receptors family 1 profile domain-containing protein n=1 Tax=Allacma fusca TaxID=39272 RepID=A0A8J2Q787_9HEXA|nr:unnamed protein product [Allacma fusca]